MNKTGERSLVRRLGMFFSCWMIVATVLGGCSRAPKHPPTAPVHGTVTYHGKPVEGAQVAFLCSQAGGRPAIGKTDAEGRYTLSTFGVNDGALIGRHSITISKFVFDRRAEATGKKSSLPTTFLPPDGMRDRANGDAYYALPRKYSDVTQSGLTANVEPTGSEIDFCLTD
jgi:hypothetical protein